MAEWEHLLGPKDRELLDLVRKANSNNHLWAAISKELQARLSRVDSEWTKLQGWELNKIQGRKEALEEALHLPEIIENSLKTKAENRRSKDARRE